MPTPSGPNISKWASLLLAGDILVFALSVLLGYLLGAQIRSGELFLQEHAVSVVGLGLAYLIILYIGELYNYYLDFRQRENIARSFLGPGGDCGGSYYILFPHPEASSPRVHGMAGPGLHLAPGGLALSFFRPLLSPLRLKKKVIIVGAGHSGRGILEAIRRRPHAGLEPVGFVDDDPVKAGGTIEGLQVLGDSRSLESLVKQHKAKMVVLAITHEKSSDLVNTLADLSYNAYQVTDMPSLFETLAGKVPTEHISDAWLLFHGLNKSKIYYRHFKRLLDVAAAVIGLALTSPLFLVCAAAIKLDSHGPVLFRQQRLGLHRKPFTILKFRSMVQDADKDIPRYAASKTPVSPALAGF